LRDIKSLTAIRGVAALWVVLHHLSLLYFYPRLNAVTGPLWLGYTGVDIFFVLSGFILTKVHLAMDFAGLKQFALRRVLRIYPLHLAVLAVLVFSARWSSHAIEWGTLPAVALLIQPYLGLTHGLWNAPSWSAGVELSCYLLFPLALFSFRMLPASLLFLLVAAAGYWEWHIEAWYAGAWTDWPCVVRGWGGFALGMALGLLSGRVLIARSVTAVGEVIAIALFSWAFARLDARLVPLAAALLIWMLSYEAGPVARVLALRMPVFLGKISFSIYMIQVPLMDAFKQFWPVNRASVLGWRFCVREVVFFGLLIGLAALTYRLVEQPGQWFLRGRKQAAGNDIAAGLA
jgi:peptidoglycan/LPS O-acetylase OafA/YrhL